MPRIYIRKTLRATCYTPEDLESAISRVKEKELTMYAASKEYNIPVTTLHNRIYQKTGIKSSSLGRPTALPQEAEVALANGLAVLEKWGFGLSRKEVLSLVEEFVRVNNISTPFKDGIPGPDWFTNFRKRHNLSLKKAQPIEHVRRKNTDPFIVAEYFNLLKSTIEKLNLEDKPHQIYNLDETSVSLDPSKTKVVGKKGAPCSRTTHGTGKEHITVLTAVNACAKKITPLIVFKGKYIWDSWTAETKNEYDFELSYASSKRGWMETDIFYNYMNKVLIPGLGEERPVLVIYDDHSTHVDIKVVELAQKHDITILKLPPHTSHHLQPLDVAVFASFKTSWDAKLVDWQRHNVGVKLPKKVFSDLFAEIWNNTKPEIIISGFRKAGIHPFNSQVISVDKYDPRAYKRWEEMQKTKDTPHSVEPNSQMKNIVDNPKTPQTNSEIEKTNENYHLPQDSSLNLLKDFANIETLSELCLVVINRTTFHNCLQRNEIKSCLSPINGLIEDIEFMTESPMHESENVALLKDLSNHEEQALAFVADSASNLPKCLLPKKALTDNNSITSGINNLTESKIKITSNVSYSYSFEDLLLQRVQQSPRNNNTMKKKRVALGAEVITEKMINKKVLQTEIVIPKKKLKTSKNKKTNKDRELANDNNNKLVAIGGETSLTGKKVIETGMPKKSNGQKQIQKKRKIKNKQYYDSETESSSSETKFEPANTDESDYENMDEFIEKCLEEQNEDLENIEPDINIPYGLSDPIFDEYSKSKIKEEDWLLVQFSTKKSLKHFVGKVLSVKDQALLVKFVRKVKQSKSEIEIKFSYPIVDDVYTVKHIEDVICVLPQPVISRRGQIIFNVDLSQYNIQ